MVSGRKPNMKRRAEIARLRARGLSLAEIGRRTGMSKQGVHEALAFQRRPLTPRDVACAGCHASIPSAGALPSDAGQALCLTCLRRRPNAPFGLRLKAFRLAAGLMKAELADRVGVSSMAIHHYESGAREPRWSQLAPLVRALGPGLVTLGLTEAG
jgi:transcriptional regulator with XRE-family HTH domain